jgi:hypothetical protein
LTPDAVPFRGFEFLHRHVHGFAGVAAMTVASNYRAALVWPCPLWRCRPQGNDGHDLLLLSRDLIAQA